MFEGFREIELNRQEARIIADDLERKLGVPVRNIQQFDTHRDRQLVLLVLPLIAEWVPRAQLGDIRAALLTVFHTRYAHPFLPQLIDWLRTEEHRPALRELKFAISIAMRPSDARLVWEVLKSKHLDSADIPFLLRLGNRN